jgi:hypothetical protein
MSDFITQAEFARRMGVHRSQVTLALKSGRIEFAIGTTKIDFDKSKRQWESNRTDTLSGTRTSNKKIGCKTPGSDMDPNEKVPEIGKIKDIGKVLEVDGLGLDDEPDSDDDSDQGDNTFNAQKIREIKAKAGRQELKLEQEKGDLIAKGDVLKVYFTFLIAIKNSILATPDRVVGAIQAAVEEYVNDPEQMRTSVYGILRQEHVRILQGMEERLKTAGAEAEKIAKMHR